MLALVPIIEASGLAVVDPGGGRVELPRDGHGAHRVAWVEDDDARRDGPDAPSARQGRIVVLYREGPTSDDEAWADVVALRRALLAADAVSPAVVQMPDGDAPWSVAIADIEVAHPRNGAGDLAEGDRAAAVSLAIHRALSPTPPGIDRLQTAATVFETEVGDIPIARTQVQVTLDPDGGQTWAGAVDAIATALAEADLVPLVRAHHRDWPRPIEGLARLRLRAVDEAQVLRLVDADAFLIQLPFTLIEDPS